MNESDLEKYKTAWKEEKSFNRQTLSDSDIRTYLLKRSKGLINFFKTGLVFDIVLKIFLGISFGFLIILFQGNIYVIALCLASIIVMLYLIWLNYKIYRIIPGQEDYAGDIRYFLKTRIDFYRTKYIKTVYGFAISYPFIFLSGMLFYFNIKYGAVRTLDGTDIIVFTLLGLASFVFGAVVHILQYGFQIGQMEECLRELDENGLDELTMMKHKKKRRSVILIFIVALVTGLLLLGFLIII